MFHWQSIKTNITQLRQKTQFVSAVISTIVLTSCQPNLEVGPIENRIKTSLNQQSGLSVQAITCPEDIPKQAGKSFECIGQLQPDSLFFVTVKQVDNQGTVNWEVPNSWRLLNLKSLQAEIQATLTQQTKTATTINCGGDYRPILVGQSFNCQVAIGNFNTTSAVLSQAQASPLETSSIPPQIPQPATVKPTHPMLDPKTDSIQVRVETEGHITWQVVRQPISVASNHLAAAATGNLPGIVSNSNGDPLPPSKIVPSTVLHHPSATSANLGRTDQTGWAELGE